MPAQRINLYVGPPLAEAVAGWADGTRSARVNAIAERYMAIVERSCPALSEAEWHLLCDILNSSLRSADMARLLWAEIEDSAEDGVGQKWEVDVPALAARVKAMTFAEQISIIEIVDRWWAAGGRRSLSEIGVSLSREVAD